MVGIAISIGLVKNCYLKEQEAVEDNSLVLCLAAGQSLAANMFSSFGGVGSQSFKDNLEEHLLPDRLSDYINGAEGGSYAARTSYVGSGLTNDEYWWDNVGGAEVPGPELEDCYAAVLSNSYTYDQVKYVIWSQGEADSNYIPASTSRAEYKRVLKAIFDHMRTTFGSQCKIIIQPLGRRSVSGVAVGSQHTREVQKELASEYDYISIAADNYDVPMLDETGTTDGVHPAEAGLVTNGYRDSMAVLKELGIVDEGYEGPKVVSTSMTDNIITVTIQHDEGTDIVGSTDKTPAGGKVGFFRAFSPAGSELTISSVTVTSPTTIELELAIIPFNNVTLYGGYQALYNVDITNSVIRDNSDAGLVLQTFKTTVTCGNSLSDLPGLFALFDGDASTVTQASGHITSIQNLVNGSNNALPNSSNPTPVYVSNHNSHAAYYADSSANVMMECNLPSGFSTSTPYYAVLVFDSDDSTADPTTGSVSNVLAEIGGTSATVPAYRINNVRTNTGQLQLLGYGLSTNSDTTDTNTKVVEIVYDGTNVNAWVNGALDSACPYTANTSGVVIDGTLRLFNSFASPSQRGMLGWLHFAAFTNTAVSTAQRQEYLTAIKSRYGIA